MHVSALETAHVGILKTFHNRGVAHLKKDKNGGLLVSGKWLGQSSAHSLPDTRLKKKKESNVEKKCVSLD